MKNTSIKSQFTEAKTPIDVLLGRAAMMGFLIAFSAYLTVDMVNPGII